jgi:hypothetical protein
MVVQHIKEAVEPVLTARAASVTALRRLSQIRNGQPNGARVIFWAPEDAKNPPEDPSPFLATKNVKAQRYTKKPTDLDDKEFAHVAAELRKADGVILSSGFSLADRQRLRSEMIPLLAVYDEVERDRAERQARQKEAGKPPNDVSIVYTGVIPVVYKAQRELLNSLIQSTCWSFGTITPLMMYVCGGVLAGLVVILPNALPVLLVFGGMGWLNIPVDIGSMMAASIALGVAVDDTIHFLAWFRDDFTALGDRRAAVLSAYRRSASATLQAALINGLGLSVFATSSFTPTKRFGWLMLAILIAGMVSELVMLPSLLFGSLGKAFEGKKKKKAQAEPPSDVKRAPPPRLDRPEILPDRPHTYEPQPTGVRRQA